MARVSWFSGLAGAAVAAAAVVAIPSGGAGAEDRPVHHDAAATTAVVQPIVGHWGADPTRANPFEDPEDSCPVGDGWSKVTMPSGKHLVCLDGATSARCDVPEVEPECAR